ncbi:MAG: ABC transporter permease, partial [Pseudomonadota bacterium]|nr:ABC transporter permease [Pseudomonadota bacterium]
MNRVIFSALLSHWLRHKVQFVTLFLGLALATALWSGVQSINAQARASYDDAAGSIGQRGYDKLVSETGVSLDDFVQLRRMGYLVSPELEGLLVVGADRVQLTGFDPLTSPPRLGMASLDEQGLFAFLSDQGLVLASPETAETLTGFWGDDGPIVQVSAEVPIGQALTDVTTAQSL